MRILVLMLKDFVPPESIEGLTEKQMAPWRTEYDVASTLHNMGHDVRSLGVDNDLGVVRKELHETKPKIVFNLLEEFGGLSTYVSYVLGYLELLRQPYTGCNPRGMMTANDKALMKKIVRHHRISVPDFTVFPWGKAVRRPRRLAFPLIVKSATEHGSVGIAQASVVQDDEQLSERVSFVHEQLGTDAIAEQYIEGREFYVGVIGNRRLRTFPVRELMLTKLADGVPRIATEKVKWDIDYQEKQGIRTCSATDLPSEVEGQMHKLCKRVYRILGLSGYARMDLRLNDQGKIFLLEPNPNPDLAWDDEFAQAAEAVGITYERLLDSILRLGLRYEAGWKV
jgi:D-alanine-D-alanine ligase